MKIKVMTCRRFGGCVVPPAVLSLRKVLRSQETLLVAPSSEAPLAFTGACLLDAGSSESTSRGEAKR